MQAAIRIVDKSTGDGVDTARRTFVPILSGELVLNDAEEVILSPTHSTICNILSDPGYPLGLSSSRQFLKRQKSAIGFHLRSRSIRESKSHRPSIFKETGLERQKVSDHDLQNDALRDFTAEKKILAETSRRRSSKKKTPLAKRSSSFLPRSVKPGLQGSITSLVSSRSITLIRGLKQTSSDEEERKQSAARTVKKPEESDDAVDTTKPMPRKSSRKGKSVGSALQMSAEESDYIKKLQRRTKSLDEGKKSLPSDVLESKVSVVSRFAKLESKLDAVTSSTQRGVTEIKSPKAQRVARSSSIVVPKPLRAPSISRKSRKRSSGTGAYERQLEELQNQLEKDKSKRKKGEGPASKVKAAIVNPTRLQLIRQHLKIGPKETEEAESDERESSESLSMAEPSMWELLSKKRDSEKEKPKFVDEIPEETSEPKRPKKRNLIHSQWKNSSMTFVRAQTNWRKLVHSVRRASIDEKEKYTLKNTRWDDISAQEQAKDEDDSSKVMVEFMKHHHVHRKSLYRKVDSSTIVTRHIGATETKVSIPRSIISSDPQSSPDLLDSSKPIIPESLLITIQQKMPHGMRYQGGSMPEKTKSSKRLDKSKKRKPSVTSANIPKRIDSFGEAALQVISALSKKKPGHKELDGTRDVLLRGTESAILTTESEESPEEDLPIKPSYRPIGLFKKFILEEPEGTTSSDTPYVKMMKDEFKKEKLRKGSYHQNKANSDTDLTRASSETKIHESKSDSKVSFEKVIDAKWRLIEERNRFKGQRDPYAIHYTESFMNLSLPMVPVETPPGKDASSKRGLARKEKEAKKLLLKKASSDSTSSLVSFASSLELPDAVKRSKVLIDQKQYKDELIDTVTTKTKLKKKAGDRPLSSPLDNIKRKRSVTHPSSGSITFLQDDMMTDEAETDIAAAEEATEMPKSPKYSDVTGLRDRPLETEIAPETKIKKIRRETIEGQQQSSLPDGERVTEDDEEQLKPTESDIAAERIMKGKSSQLSLFASSTSSSEDEFVKHDSETPVAADFDEKSEDRKALRRTLYEVDTRSEQEAPLEITKGGFTAERKKTRKADGRFTRAPETVAEEKMLKRTRIVKRGEFAMGKETKAPPEEKMLKRTRREKQDEFTMGKETKAPTEEQMLIETRSIKHDEFEMGQEPRIPSEEKMLKRTGKEKQDEFAMGKEPRVLSDEKMLERTRSAKQDEFATGKESRVPSEERILKRTPSAKQSSSAMESSSVESRDDVSSITKTSEASYKSQRQDTPKRKRDNKPKGKIKKKEQKYTTPSMADLDRLEGISKRDDSGRAQLYREDSEGSQVSKTTSSMILQSKKDKSDHDAGLVDTGSTSQEGAELSRTILFESAMTGASDTTVKFPRGKDYLTPKQSTPDIAMGFTSDNFYSKTSSHMGDWLQKQLKDREASLTSVKDKVLSFHTTSSLGHAPLRKATFGGKEVLPPIRDTKQAAAVKDLPFTGPRILKPLPGRVYTFIKPFSRLSSEGHSEKSSLSHFLRSYVHVNQERAMARAQWLSRIATSDTTDACARPPLQPRIKRRFQGWDGGTSLESHTMIDLPDFIDNVPTLIKALTDTKERIQKRCQDEKNYHKNIQFSKSPAEVSQEYTAYHGIEELFQFMLTSVVQNRPDDPLNYLIELTRGILRQMSKRQTMDDLKEKQARFHDPSSHQSLRRGLNRTPSSTLSNMSNASTYTSTTSSSSSSPQSQLSSAPLRSLSSTTSSSSSSLLSSSHGVYSSKFNETLRL
ncbi:uncharacterized protein LOC106057828 isoform X2 [Biomphalaria glabrata]|uniref:Uncharacterized protein LOC106057828 isoform X2 n=1 Tax=Biomphalaria glabrata TaxID=6526 RepID=A0A9W2Z5X1_BIOGL|nr:uncharacterized protein LOC106057828 isoform X2 [Biomphalaria glabrata]